MTHPNEARYRIEYRCTACRAIFADHLWDGPGPMEATCPKCGRTALRTAVTKMRPRSVR